MSVLVKDMTMPRDCPMCPMTHWNAFNMISGCEVVPGKKYAIRDPEYANSNHQPDWCPLVDVSPHGRLIDADALAVVVEDISKEFPPNSIGAERLRLFKELITTAPTIIPAEEDET